MYIPFEDMKGSSRIWIYQSDRIFTENDLAIIQEKSESFFAQWAAHGQDLKSSYNILHSKFLVVGVDEGFNQASGCSIDASVALIRSLEQELDINFFDRTKVCFLVDDEVMEIPLTNIKNQIKEGIIHSSTKTFDNLVTNIEALNERWTVEAKNSWLKRYF